MTIKERTQQMMTSNANEAVMRGKVAALALFVATLLAALSMMLAAASPAHAFTNFFVNNDVDPGDGKCEANGGCTLRDAIIGANSNNNPQETDVINFAIPGDGPHTIQLQSELPEIQEPVIIDGYTQAESSANTLARGTNAKLMIELDGSAAGGSSDGLVVKAPNVLVRGLAINGFGNNGVVVGNNIFGDDTTGVRVEGNFIGTDATGTVDLGNGGEGVHVSGFTTRATVGGSAPEARNLISGNAGSGVFALSAGVNVLGNLIGTESDGLSALGNSSSGVILRTEGAVVGGDAAGAANTIAFNGANGVEIADIRTVGQSVANGVLRNSIFSNAGLGIDLGADGATANDAGDADIGPNNLLNKPALTSAVTSGDQTTIKGKLSSKPDQVFVVRFYFNPAGENEGKTFLGQRSVTTGSDGKASFTFKPTRKVGPGKAVTATTSDFGGNTSEFSAPRAVVAQ